MSKKRATAVMDLAAMTARQRRQIGEALDCLTDASAHLSALIESEPDGLRDLLTVRLHVDACAVVLMRRYGEPVPPAPARISAAQASGKDAA